MKTNQQRKEQVWKEYDVMVTPEWKKCKKIKDQAEKEFEAMSEPLYRKCKIRCGEIDKKVEDVILVNGRKYKLID